MGGMSVECVSDQALIRVGRKTRASYVLLNFSLLCAAFKDQMWGEEIRPMQGKFFFFFQEGKQDVLSFS